MAPVSGSNLQIREREPSSESADSEREREAAEREEERRELSSKEVWRRTAFNRGVRICGACCDGKVLCVLL